MKLKIKFDCLNPIHHGFYRANGMQFQGFPNKSRLKGISCVHFAYLLSYTHSDCSHSVYQDSESRLDEHSLWSTKIVCFPLHSRITFPQA